MERVKAHRDSEMCPQEIHRVLSRSIFEGYAVSIYGEVSDRCLTQHVIIIMPVVTLDMRN